MKALLFIKTKDVAMYQISSELYERVLDDINQLSAELQDALYRQDELQMDYDAAEAANQKLEDQFDELKQITVRLLELTENLTAKNANYEKLIDEDCDLIEALTNALRAEQERNEQLEDAANHFHDNRDYWREICLAFSR